MLKKVVTENFKMEKEGKIDYNRRTEERNETNWKEKSLSWEWLKLGYVKKNTEATITTNQDQALTTRWIKANVDGVDCYPLCRVCRYVDELSMHIASGCKQSAKRRYMIRHNLTSIHVHWELFRKFEIKVTKTWYENVPLQRMVTQTAIEILWDIQIKTTTKINHNRPDTVIKMTGERQWLLINTAIPQDHNTASKEHEKVNKYIDLASVIRTEHNVRTEIITLVIGALGNASK